MGRKRRGRLPPWSYLDNEYSAFGMVASDLLKSAQYQNLSLAAKNLYVTVVAHAKSTEAQECAFNALVQRYLELGVDPDGAKLDASREVHERGAFCFPSAHYKKYGFERRTISRYMKELREFGFIETIQAGQLQHRVSIYRFSEKWKKSRGSSGGHN